MSLITMRNILVKKGSKNVLDVSFLAVQKGEAFAIIGPNGAGKTTLLMCLARLERLARGSVFWQEKQIGKDISEIAFRQKIAVVFQQPLLFSESVFDNVAYGLKLRGYVRRDISERVMRYLNYFNIGWLAKRQAKTLSGGEAQRVALARALVLEPEALLLDEPFASLDAPTSEKIISDLKNTIKENHTTLFLVTHNRFEALQLTSKLLALEGGKVAQEGLLIDVFQKPANEFVAAFSGIDTILRGEVLETRAGLVRIAVAGRCIEAVGDFAVGSRVAAFIRPENIVLSTSSPEGTSARNHFTAKIVESVPFGHYHKVFLDCGFTLNSVVANSTITELDITSGRKIFVSFKATAVHLVAD